MILKITIAVLVIYYLILAIWLRKKQSSTNTDITIMSKKARSIIGKSTYVVNTAPKRNNQTQCPEIYHQPMQVDFEMKYDDDEEDNLIDLELEEIGLSLNEVINSAQGLSFEEMSQVVEVIQNNKNMEDEIEERQVVQTIAEIEHSELFDLMILQIDGGRRRVAELLSKIDNEVSHENIDISETDRGLMGFDLGRYLQNT